MFSPASNPNISKFMRGFLIAWSVLVIVASVWLLCNFRLGVVLEETYNNEFPKGTLYYSFLNQEISPKVGDIILFTDSEETVRIERVSHIAGETAPFWEYVSFEWMIVEKTVEDGCVAILYEDEGSTVAETVRISSIDGYAHPFSTVREVLTIPIPLAVVFILLGLCRKKTK